MYVQQKIQLPFQENLKTILPTIAGNDSIAFPTSLLSASASLSNHFFRVFLSFDGEPPVPPLPPASSSKNICNDEDNCWNSHGPGSQY